MWHCVTLFLLWSCWYEGVPLKLRKSSLQSDFATVFGNTGILGTESLKTLITKTRISKMQKPSPDPRHCSAAVRCLSVESQQATARRPRFHRITLSLSTSNGCRGCEILPGLCISKLCQCRRDTLVQSQLNQMFRTRSRGMTPRRKGTAP